MTHSDVKHSDVTHSDDSAQNKSSRRRSRDRRGRQILARLWSEWRVEILIVLVIAFAIFLLVEQMQIRQTLFGWLREGLRALKSLSGGVARGLVDLVQRTTLSDLTAYVLLFGAFVLLAWRARWRLMTMPRFTERECPHCGSDLRRVHRRPIDRLVGVYVPVARYRCGNRDCRWHGLRVKKTRHE